MNISSLVSAGLNTLAAATPAASSSGNALSMTSLSADDFLKLLLIELKNQDPTKPMDSTSMLQQFSTLTQVQQTQQANNYLQSLLQSTLSQNNIQSVGYIGKKISYTTDRISVAGGKAAASKFTLAADASKVSVTITDANGTAVKTSDLGNMSAGSYSFQWDGTNGSGAKVADGTYKVSFSAKDSTGKNISVSTEGTASVTGIVFRNGASYLVTDAGEIPFLSVTGVSG
jgi:flagellar basal-body rod modification protein FlgD